MMIFNTFNIGAPHTPPLTQWQLTPAAPQPLASKVVKKMDVQMESNARVKAEEVGHGEFQGSV